MKRKRIIITATIILLSSIVLSVTFISLRVKTQVKEMFKLNKTLQEEGYYMADFEFNMVGCGYYLGKGQYYKSVMFLNEYHKKLSSREGLIKIPRFKNKKEEIYFYLNLQNPRTGAFIDTSAPYCTFWEVTQNTINHLEALTDSTTAPLTLKYPLTFLDEINTPEKLTAFLDDISYVGWLASKFPQTSFHFARNILSAAKPDNTLERNKLYTFSPEWKHAMVKWMYDFQDTTTGLWGPKDRQTGQLTKFDLNNTASILNDFRDNDGNDLYAEFPLKYQDKLFKSAIAQLSEPFPNEENLPEIHEWNLRQSKGIKMLLRYLWKDASDDNKKKAERIIARNIDICFEKYYVKEDGAFSYYPNAQHASGDGSTNLILRHIGAFSFEKQKKLWGDPSKNKRDMGMIILHELKTSDWDSIVNIPGINSVRIYANTPNEERLTDGVWAVYYPRDTLVLDIMELVPNMVRWTESTSLSMGNWTSMAEIKKEYSKLNIKRPLIYKDKLPFDEVNRKFKEAGELSVVGFDKFQVPRGKMKFKYTTS
ncbi:MAG: hypothetical protein EHM64_04400 [Ignavibacteriae bacterium]|nr:MAG: hypothetical protein EHM64_04400 [Ignavibacteriota bacterium]